MYRHQRDLSLYCRFRSSCHCDVFRRYFLCNTTYNTYLMWDSELESAFGCRSVRPAWAQKSKSRQKSENFHVRMACMQPAHRLANHDDSIIPRGMCIRTVNVYTCGTCPDSYDHNSMMLAPARLWHNAGQL